MARQGIVSGPRLPKRELKGGVVGWRLASKRKRNENGGAEIVSNEPLKEESILRNEVIPWGKHNVTSETYMEIRWIRRNNSLKGEGLPNTIRGKMAIGLSRGGNRQSSIFLGKSKINITKAKGRRRENKAKGDTTSKKGGTKI